MEVRLQNNDAALLFSNEYLVENQEFPTLLLKHAFITGNTPFIDIYLERRLVNRHRALQWSVEYNQPEIFRNLIHIPYFRRYIYSPDTLHLLEKSLKFIKILVNEIPLTEINNLLYVILELQDAGPFSQTVFEIIEFLENHITKWICKH